MNAVNTDYDDSFFAEIKFQISEHFISTCVTCDPWTNAQDSSQLLSSFANWGPNGFDYHFAIASLWTNRQFELTDNGSRVIGKAYIDGICRKERRYNVLTEQFGNNNLGRLRNLTSHELGHNFDAQHTPGSNCVMDEAIGFGQGNTCWSNQSQTSINGAISAVTYFGGCLFGCGCISNLNITNDLLSGQSEIREVSNQILAYNTINSNSTASYDAGNSVVLRPGFTARTGSTFNAFIDGCSGSREPQDNQKSTSYFKNNSILKEELDVKIYPNPTKGEFLVENKDLEIINWEVYDQFGISQLKNRAIIGKTINIDLSTKQTGVYFMRLTLASGEIISKSIVKK